MSKIIIMPSDEECINDLANEAIKAASTGWNEVFIIHEGVCISVTNKKTFKNIVDEFMLAAELYEVPF